MKFIDEVQIEIFSGNGGHGSSSMKREKFIPFGGPDGGDGGRGGNVYAIADRNINTLIHFKYKKIYSAGNGKNGMGCACYGKSGFDIILKMPIGTIITEINTGKLISDLTKDGQIALLAQGGKGGLGNIHFKTSINRSPRKKTYGQNGEHKILHIELKILADVGLFGMPNSGKSAFISIISNAKPKIANYPFTTLTPNLGVVNIGYNNFVIADIPGLIKGASHGIGLGYKFLRHLQRTILILHIVDLYSFYENIKFSIKEIEIINELNIYSKKLYEKPRWLILNKIDLIPQCQQQKTIQNFIKILKWNDPFFVISSLTGQGCDILINEIYNFLINNKKIL